MVRVASLGPCDGGAIVWQRGGRHFLTVAVRATFSIEGEGKMVPIEPTELCPRDHHIDDNVTRSITRAEDVALFKPFADTVLIGSAHAAPGTTTTRCDVRLAVSRGDTTLFDKRLAVMAEAFSSFPLGYEKAFGGLGFADNPFGVGHDGTASPNIVNVAHPRAVGSYGPLSSLWYPRKALARGVSRSELRARRPSLPDDFDLTYYQCAPKDQRTAYLVGNETVWLEGLHPRRVHSQHTLPNARAAAAVFGLTDGRVPIAMHADTLHIHPDEGFVAMVWRGVADVESIERVEEAVVAVGVASEHAPVDLPSAVDAVDAIASPAELMATESTMRLTGMRALSRTQAPFEVAKPSSRRRPSTPPWKAQHAHDVVSPSEDLSSTVVLAESGVGIARATTGSSDDSPPTPEPETPSEPRVDPEPEAAPPLDASPPAVTPEGVPVRWARASQDEHDEQEEAADAPTRAPTAAKAPRVPQLPKRNRPDVYKGLRSAGKKREDA